MKTAKPHQIAISLKIEMNGETVHLENYETEITAGMLKNNIQDFIHRFIQPFTEAEQKRLASQKRKLLSTKFAQNDDL